MITSHALKGLCGAVALAASCAPAAFAADYYQGKTVTLTVGSGAGGGYDGYARLLARHWGRLIAGNPNFVVKNMPGAGSLKATMHIYSVAPKDGLHVGAIQNGVVFEPLFKLMSKGKDAQFDATKLNWVGAVTKETSVMVVWHTAPFKTIEDLRKTKILTGASGPTTSYGTYPRLMNATMGTNIQIVMGYTGTSDITLALERGEIQAMTGWDYSSVAATKSDWLKNKQINILVQFGAEPHPEMPNVPLAKNHTTSQLNRDVLELISARQEIGRPYIAPPDTPAEYMSVIRGSFNAMMKDAAFLADAKKARFEIIPSTAEQAAQVIKTVYGFSPEVIAKARAVLVVEDSKKKKKK